MSDRGNYGFSNIPMASISYGPQIAIVGAGPRGTSVLERISASAMQFINHDSWLTIHIIDQYPPGAGKVWRTDQSALLMMNTPASQNTLFTDDSVKCNGPIVKGLSLYDWLKRNDHIIGPNGYPTRVQCGTYLRWVYDHVVETLPKNVRVKFYPAQAQELLEGSIEGLYKLRLSTGEIDNLSAVILAQGHVEKDLVDDKEDVGEVKKQSRYAEEHKLIYVPPCNAANSDLSNIKETDSVLMVGLGLGFIDYLALLTEGRGGEFVEENCKLVYKCSEKEPKAIYCFSRRGVPYHARAPNQRTAEQQHKPLFITQERIKQFRENAKNEASSFEPVLWPLIVKEVEFVYYRQLLRLRDEPTETIKKFENDFVTGSDKLRRELIKSLNLEAWDWNLVKHPEKTFNRELTFQSNMIRYLEEDVRQAQLGDVYGPHAAARSVLRHIRNDLRHIIDHRGVRDNDKKDLSRRFASLDLFLATGPPLIRIQQLVALMDANIVKILPKSTKISEDENKWKVESIYPETSATEDQQPKLVDVLIEARVQKPSLENTSDTLLRNMFMSGKCQSHINNGINTGGLDINEKNQVITKSQASAEDNQAPVDNSRTPGDDSQAPAEDKVDDRLFALGIPTEGVVWMATYLPVPNSNSAALLKADTVARGALRRAQKDLIDGKVDRAVQQQNQAANLPNGQQ
ncbi:8c47adda-eed2-4545-b558-541a3c7f55e6-CDS [Sclerotinia trifoliorum]|uniref:8c47adda-eed2-4545-b558-541a3c7f55e6-CDS n=1 Tax=Sclerotinia trifoliorum TaxID=28548 RepID=A0A8H2VW90_9HELO|nr:8c47adda-eed2-4545-b558-541a3c7f55e6-CDS [Sclerotinia trifoliorum]